MSVQELTGGQAVVVSGEALHPLGWAMQARFGPGEVVIIGRQTAYEAMVALDGLRGRPDAAEPPSAVDVDTARHVADGIFAALCAAPGRRFAEVWDGGDSDQTHPSAAPASSSYAIISFRTDEA